MTTPYVYQPIGRRPDLLDSREQALVRLAADGLTDEEIGHLMGLHPLAVRCLARLIRQVLADPLGEQGNLE